MDDFAQDVIIGDAAYSGQQNVEVNDGTTDRELTAKIIASFSTTNENGVNVQTLERCFNEMINREKGSIVDTVENKIQNAVLTAIDKIIVPKTELAVR